MKDIKEYEGYYQADEDGNIYSVARWVDHNKSKKQFVPAKKRVLSLHGTGYLTVRLAKEGVVKTHRVHRLIAESFIPKKAGDGDLVNHKNGIKTDNRVENLEWCSAQQNSQHALMTGLMNCKGVFNPSAKLSKDDISEIYELIVVKREKIQDVAIKFGVSRNTISKVLDREYGHVWRLVQKPQYRKSKAI